MDCEKNCMNGWTELITYTGKTYEDRIEHGQTIFGYDRYFKTTISIAKGIVDKDGIPLYVEMVHNEELKDLNKHSSVAIPCGCKR